MRRCTEQPLGMKCCFPPSPSSQMVVSSTHRRTTRGTTLGTNGTCCRSKGVSTRLYDQNSRNNSTSAATDRDGVTPYVVEGHDSLSDNGSSTTPFPGGHRLAYTRVICLCTCPVSKAAPHATHTHLPSTYTRPLVDEEHRRRRRQNSSSQQYFNKVANTPKAAQELDGDVPVFSKGLSQASLRELQPPKLLCRREGARKRSVGPKDLSRFCHHLC